MNEPDPYEVLGVEPDASPDEIRAAFRRLVRSRHPDTAVHPSDGGDLRAVLDAYRRLMDPAERDRIDRSRRSAAPKGGRRIPVRRTSHTGRDPAAGGRARCPDCGGTGRVRSVLACATCGGAGRMAALRVHGPAVAECPACAGRGRIAAVTACDGCGGSGLRPPPR